VRGSSVAEGGEMGRPYPLPVTPEGGGASADASAPVLRWRDRPCSRCGRPLGAGAHPRMYAALVVENGEQPPSRIRFDAQLCAECGGVMVGTLREWMVDR
jgi:hypothetical protein